MRDADASVENVHDAAGTVGATIGVRAVEGSLADRRRVAAVDTIKVPRGGRLRARHTHAAVGLDELHLVKAEEQVERVVVQVSGKRWNDVERLDALSLLFEIRGHVRSVRELDDEATRELLGAAAMVGLWAGPHCDEHVTVACGKRTARLGILIVGALQCLCRCNFPHYEQDEEDKHLSLHTHSTRIIFGQFRVCMHE